VLEALLQQGGVESSWVASGALALGYLAQRPVDAVVTDLRMPDMDGMQLLQQVRSRHPEVAVIMMTAHGTVQVAVGRRSSTRFERS